MDQTLISEGRRPRRPPAENIPGWGIDLPTDRRVGEPREGNFTALENGAHWETPEQQATDVKIFVSVERPGITPVFGTTLPPKGLSGILRSVAYGLGEAKRRRWMTLMLADRVDVIESMAENFLLSPPKSDGSRRVRPVALLSLGAFVLGAGYLLTRKRIAEGVDD